MIHFGLLTAILDGWSFEEAIDTAAEMGFECLEVACWPAGKAERRYAGVSHIDAERVLEDDAYAKYVTDYVAAKGMRVLANPLENDPRVISGESGASTTGLVCELMEDSAFETLRNRIGLNAHSRILCFSTEGDTDRENYRRVLWDGAYPKP